MMVTYIEIEIQTTHGDDTRHGGERQHCCKKPADLAGSRDAVMLQTTLAEGATKACECAAVISSRYEIAIILDAGRRICR
jgi:hypothetical protein